MSMKNKIATIFGGTGFVGRQIVRELAERGVIVKVATRIPERAYFLKPAGAVGQIVPVQCDYSDEKSIVQAVEGSDFVINCIGILFQKGKKQRFQNAHVEIPTMIAKASAKAGADKLVHISALGVDKGTSKYAKTKLEGEKALKKAFPQATILRPSVIFGEDDSFFNMFAEMARYMPALPLIGGGKTRFQPVFVGDVCDAVMAALTNDETQGQIYELGGPDVVTFEEIFERLFQYTGRRRGLISIPFGIAKMEACFMSLLPKPPLTCDQVESLKTDNVVSKKALGFEDLGFSPTAMDVILPTYLKSYRSGGRFADVKKGSSS